MLHLLLAGEPLSLSLSPLEGGVTNTVHVYDFTGTDDRRTDADDKLKLLYTSVTEEGSQLLELLWN